MEVTVIVTKVTVVVGSNCNSGNDKVTKQSKIYEKLVGIGSMMDCSDQTSNGLISVLTCHLWISNADTTQYMKDL